MKSGKKYHERKEIQEAFLPLSGRLNKKEWLLILLKAVGIAVLAVWLCYRSLAALPAAIPIALFFGRIMVQEAIEKKKHQMRLHFRDFLSAVHMAVRSGYALENAVRSGYRDLVLLYGKKDDLAMAMEQVIRQMEYQVPVEKLFYELGRNTGIREVQSFAELISITKRTGGNIGKVLSDSWMILNRRMDTEMEIETLLAAKKYEQSVMSLMPAVMILYLQLSFPGFTDHLYGNTAGRLVMTAALLLYLGAFLLGRRMVRIEV